MKTLFVAMRAKFGRRNRGSSVYHRLADRRRSGRGGLLFVLFCVPLIAISQEMFVGLAVKRVVFTNDHNLLKNYNVNFEGDGSVLFAPRGWQLFDDGTSVTNPVSITRNIIAAIEVDHRVGPAGNSYVLTGAANSIGAIFRTADLVSTGSWTTDTIQSLAVLPNRIRSAGYGMQWTTSGDVQFVYNGMGNGNIYITWGPPLNPSINSPTLKRMHWAATVADSSTTEEEAADRIWNAIGEPADPPYEPYERPLQQLATWKLLDGNVSGECDEQAALMARGMWMLGINANVQLIRASTNTNVLDLEQRPSLAAPGRPEWLILYSGSSPNAFEGCCVTANLWYAIWPKHKSGSALQMLRDLTFTQAWVLTVDDEHPDTPARVEMIVQANVPKP